MQTNSRGALAGALFLLSTIAPFILCDVRFTSPPAGASLQAGQTLIISWNDSKESVSLDPFASYSLFLCAGGDEAESQNASSHTHPYLSFLKIHAATTHGLESISLSDRFSINGMTGTFPTAVLDGLAKLSDSPALQIQKRDPQAPAAPPAGGAAAAGAAPVAPAAAPAAGAAGAGGPGAPADYAVPYTLQTGLIRYAPMQKPPGTHITAKMASRKYPTSSVRIATTFLPTPSQTTTFTMALTNTPASSHAFRVFIRSLIPFGLGEPKA
ncbi:MAG: hypothetical protein LQ342_004229 [Letrouitia transgressa]|nr:MAG: hypothetical protein LQ342_004229 [Letrouitia transgressa]